jgi:hypothetical protein
MLELIAQAEKQIRGTQQFSKREASLGTQLIQSGQRDISSRPRSDDVVG